jgi:DNA-binding CsgD family transcriptional regulator
LRLANLPNFALDRLSRYETNLSREAGRLLYALDMLDRRKPPTSQNRRLGPPIIERGRRTDPPGSDGPGASAAMQLSSRERKVLISLAHGRSNKAIARLCQLSEATVKVHLKAILRKTNTRNRTQAAIWAIEHQFREDALVEATKPADLRQSQALQNQSSE